MLCWLRMAVPQDRFRDHDLHVADAGSACVVGDHESRSIHLWPDSIAGKHVTHLSSNLGASLADQSGLGEIFGAPVRKATPPGQHIRLKRRFVRFQDGTRKARKMLKLRSIGISDYSTWRASYSAKAPARRWRRRSFARTARRSGARNPRDVWETYSSQSPRASSRQLCLCQPPSQRARHTPCPWLVPS